MIPGGFVFSGFTNLDVTKLFIQGEGNGNPLQCSCLENPRDGGAWWAAVYGVAQSQTRLKQLSSSSSIILIPGFNFLLLFNVWYSIIQIDHI